MGVVIISTLDAIMKGGGGMSRNRVEDFGAYQDAVRLFDHVVNDMAVLQKDPRCYRLVGQQVGSADSICANIEEGFGRMSRAEFIRFLDFARGSARETLGRYKRLKHWLSAGIIEARVDLADRIVAILTKTINTLRGSCASPDPQQTPSMLESSPPYRIALRNLNDEIIDTEIELILQIE
jgi:four helix bundle protein